MGALTTRFQAVWWQVNLQHLHLPQPETKGWVVEDNCFVPKLSSVSPLRDACLRLTTCTWTICCNIAWHDADESPIHAQFLVSAGHMHAPIILVWHLANFSITVLSHLKDIAHLSTFKIFIFDKFSCFIVLIVFLVIVQSSELVSVWFCEKMTFFPNFLSYHIFAIYVGGASLGLPTACGLIAVSGARLPSVDGLVVRCIKMHHQVKSAITICLQFI